jgi:hypothetical protein
MMGKGSNRRPAQVPQSEVLDRWDRIFAKQPEPAPRQQPATQEPETTP